MVNGGKGKERSIQQPTTRRIRFGSCRGPVPACDRRNSNLSHTVPATQTGGGPAVANRRPISTSSDPIEYRRVPHRVPCSTPDYRGVPHRVPCSTPSSTPEYLFPAAIDDPIVPIEWRRIAACTSSAKPPEVLVVNRSVASHIRFNGAHPRYVASRALGVSSVGRATKRSNVGSQHSLQSESENCASQECIKHEVRHKQCNPSPRQ
jgi:hypothetical protein